MRCRGHVDVLDTVIFQRIQDGVHHHRQRRRDAGFAAAFHPQRIALGRVFGERNVEERNLPRAGNAVVHEAAAEHLSVFGIADVFHQRLA
jgi:hypothetical protein